MQEDPDKEKKAITKHWAKREEQIDRVMQATAGMYGDLQGIPGKDDIENQRAGTDNTGGSRARYREWLHCGDGRSRWPWR